MSHLAWRLDEHERHLVATALLVAADQGDHVRRSHAVERHGQAVGRQE
jgi:hypothetical protein